MPIYEYICPNCNDRCQKLVLGLSDPSGLACPRCGATEVRRAISRVAMLKSEDARADALADPSMFAGLDENDPRNSRCIRCNTCDGFACLVHAKSDAQTMCVDPALRHPNVTLLTNAYVTRLDSPVAGL